MRLFKNKRKILLFCNSETEITFWKNEISQAGFGIENCDLNKKRYRRLCNQVCLFIAPSFDLLNNRNIRGLMKYLSEESGYLFIISSDERWRKQDILSNCTILPYTTHPLEFARILVEKKQLLPQNNPSSYAFSLFNF